MDNEIGKIYGNFEVLQFAYKKHSKKYYTCKCLLCGNIKDFLLYAIKTERTKSCGCLRHKPKHGWSRTKLYQKWHSMLERCRNKNHASYYKYGGKGVTVCDEWQKDFVAFKDWVLNNGYEEGLTIDRIDSSKGYSPDNCRFVTYEVQNTHLAMLKNNKSGYKGVHYIKQYDRYLVNISINNKTQYICYAKTKKEAVEARNKFIDDNNLPHEKQEYRGD